MIRMNKIQFKMPLHWNLCIYFNINSVKSFNFTFFFCDSDDLFCLDKNQNGGLNYFRNVIITHSYILQKYNICFVALKWFFLSELSYLHSSISFSLFWLVVHFWCAYNYKRKILDNFPSCWYECDHLFVILDFLKKKKNWRLPKQQHKSTN